jgi:hypothetical protein
VDQPSAGLDEPFLIYLTCFRVLEANQDPRAVAILARGHDLLQRYVDAITDDDLRRSFLERVPEHRALHQAYAVASAHLT